MVIEGKFCLSRQRLMTLSDLYKPILEFRNRLIMHLSKLRKDLAIT